MSIRLINNTQKAYVVVNKAIAMDKDLNMRDRGMMLTLMSFPPEWNFSIKGLEKIVPDGRDAISSSLQRLEEKHYLVRVQERDEKGKFADTKIYINPNPKENPMTGKPLTEIPFSAKPMTENPIQISNKETKHKELTNKKSITQSADKFSETVEAVKEQINYDVVAIDRKNDISYLDYIVDLMARTLLTEKEVIRIAGTDMVADDVKAMLKTINHFNVEFVIDRLREVDTKITDFDAYILTCLHKADKQEDMHWNNVVRQQMRGGN